MRIIDTSGMSCPGPLIETRRALRESGEGETFNVITDNLTSFSNISSYLRDNGIDYSFEESDGIWKLTVTKGPGKLPVSGINEFCSRPIPHFKQGDFIIAFTSDRMGVGDDNLGTLLLENFIKAISDLDELPQKLVFYNKGVLLASEDSPVIGPLREIEKMGVELLLCSTCVGHYSLEGKTGTGTLSNMFEITRAMVAAGKVIKP